MTRRSLALAIAGGLAGLAIIGLGVVGWRYSDLILVMPGPSSLHEQRVLDSGEDWVRLSRDDESVQPGTWALEWEDGYGWIDALRSSDDSSVVRDYRPTRGRLPVGGWVSVRGEIGRAHV